MKFFKKMLFTGTTLKKIKISEIYGCYTFGLLLKQIYQYFKKDETQKVILGTIRFNFKSVETNPKIPLANIEEY